MILLAALGLLSACSSAKNEAVHVEPAKVETVAATGVKQVVLTAQAAGRIGVTTTAVGEAQHPPGGSVRVVPYSSVLYDADGTTLVYTTAEPLVFVRRTVTVESIAGDVAYLSDGPAAGTSVVNQGAAELFGVEFGIGAFE
jgi:hypothetical protein